jgi:hypothetical protein
MQPVKHSPLKKIEVPPAILDAAYPRVCQFIKDLTGYLQACNTQIVTVPAYLLDSLKHPIEVFGSLNGVPIEMGFDAAQPEWTTEPRMRLQVSFNYGYRHLFLERGIKEAQFPVTKILKKFIQEIHVAECSFSAQTEKERKAELAQRKFADLSLKLGLPIKTNKRNVIQGDIIKIMKLPQNPYRVIVMVTISHDQAIELANKYAGTT